MTKALQRLTCAILFLLINSPVLAQTGQISGTVTDDATGSPIPGVNVVVEGTTQGAATGGEGQYTITNIEPGDYTLQASFIGYGEEMQEDVQVQAGQSTTVDFVMQQEAAGLDEVVVVGYGEQQRADLTGSVSSVSTEDIEAAPTTSVEQTLQGRVAGVQVTQSSGQPGAAATVRVRGSGSIQGGSDPLYVVDGMPVSNVQGAGVLGPGAVGSNPLATLNPNDIESIEILKDASATAIYGARGANGVVLISTKKGQRGRSQASFNAYYGWQQVRKQYDLLNAREFAQLANEAAANAENQPVFSEEEVASFGEGTNWQDEVFRAAPMQNYQLSFSGGDDDTRYFVSGSYRDQEGIVIGSDLWRGAFRANLNQDISQNFRIGNTLTLSRTDANTLQDASFGGTDGSNSSVVLDALTAAPTVPVYDESGNYFAGLKPTTGRPFSNPVASALETTNEDVKDRVIGNIFGEYDLTESITARVSVGIDYLNNSQEYYSPRTVLPGRFTNGTGRVGQLQAVTWLNENTVNYSEAFGERHDIDLLAGVTFQGSRSENSSVEAENFPNDILGPNALQTGAQINSPFTGVTKWGLVSYITRANYNLDSKYLFTLTGRVDGSSRFGEGNKYGFFPSGAMAWRLSEEDFVQDLGVFSNLKVRASYGRTGNQEIGLYQSLATLGSATYILGSRRAIGYAPDNIANPDLKWETTDQLDVGFDAGFFDNRLSITADYYHKQTSDLLLNVDVPFTSGFINSLQNVGSVQNRGVELSISTVNLTGALGWTTNLNLSFNRNEVVDLGDKEEIVAPGPSTAFGLNPTLLREGEPIGTFYGVPFRGVENGQLVYEDTNGDGQITGADRTIIGDAQPDYTGGMTNSFSYRSFDLTVFLQWSVGGDLYNANRRYLNAANGVTNHVEEVVTRPANYPTPSFDSRIDRDSDYFIEDGSYLRGKNIRLTYNAPVDGLGLGGTLRDLSVYVSAQNFFTITEYSGFDPEVSEFGSTNLGQGIDSGTYPQTRQFTVGVNLGL